MKSMETGYFICPVCGSEVKTGAKACPACGADDETGWSPGTESPEVFDAEDYSDAVQREFGGTRPVSARNVVIAGIAIVLLVAFLRAYFF